MTTFEASPDRIEEGLRIYRESVFPWLRDATGFRGWIVLVDRERGRSLSVTFWATEEAALDPGASGGALRDEIASRVGAAMTTLDVYELAVAEALDLRDA